MGRRRRGGDAPTLAFISFMDIMASLIGILSLIIVTLILSQVDPQAVEAAQKEMAEAQKRTEQLQQIKKEMEPVEQEAKRIEELKKEQLKIQQQVREAQEKIKQIEAQREKMSQSQKQTLTLQSQLQEMEKQIQELKKQQEQMQQESKTVEQELEKRKAPREEPAVKVRLSGTGEKLDAHFVEVTAQGVVIYGLGPDPIKVPAGAIAAGPDFKRLMATVKSKPNGTIIFLMREDAMGIYGLASSVATNNYVRNGKLPLVGKGKVDLSEAQKSLQKPPEKPGPASPLKPSNLKK